MSIITPWVVKISKAGLLKADESYIKTIEIDKEVYDFIKNLRRQ